MIVALFNAIAAIPSLLTAFEKLVSFLSDELNAARNRKEIADLAQASKDAELKKDTSGLDQMFDPSKKKS